MARLTTCGWETQLLSTNANFHGEGSSGLAGGLITTGAPAISTITPHSGAALLRVAAANRFEEARLLGATLGRTYFQRFYLRLSATQSNAIVVGSFLTATSVQSCGLRVDTGNHLELIDQASAQVGSDSPVLSANVWYRVELKALLDASPSSGNGVVEARLYDTDDSALLWTASSAVADLGTTAIDRARLGAIGANATTGNLDFDDWCINDSTGTDQNSWVGRGKLILAKPTADSAVGGSWEGPQTTGSDVTNLFDNLDNIPPAGVAHSDADANAGKYVFNAASELAANLDVQAQDYATAGVPSTGVITLTQAIARWSVAVSSATATFGAVKSVSNPADSGEFSNGFSFIGAATESSNWFTTRAPLVYAPSVVRSTAPVLRIGKRTATTRILMADFVGLYIEYVDGRALPISSVARRRQHLLNR